MLLKLVDSLCLGQLLALIVALRKQTDAQNYFHIQLRYDMIISQAITLVSTCLLTTIETSTPEELQIWTSRGPLVTFFGFLSCYGDERGMMEDMREIFSVFYGRVKFRFIDVSSVAKNCIPVIEAENPTDIEVSIPLQPEMVVKLPEAYKKGEWFRVRTTYWNIGVNHEATLAMSVGDISLEESINLAALAITNNYINGFPEECNENVKRLFEDLARTVRIRFFFKSDFSIRTFLFVNF